MIVGFYVLVVCSIGSEVEGGEIGVMLFLWDYIEFYDVVC